ncbi:hypothetical protein GO011_09495 [Mycobacterium sp. 20091114027_K0903767]|nr:hypothetical protein [Mycobacterium sp. 20091114027_K0903767]
MPCPNCHAQTVGRDNGQAIIDCRTCEYAWTEREYKLLVGMHVEDELEETVLRPQLDEANGRLGSIADLAAKLTDPDEVNAPGAGGIILDAIRKFIDGHQPPEQRTIGYDVASTIEQQRAEDDWTWKREEPYKKPQEPETTGGARYFENRAIVTIPTRGRRHRPRRHRGPVCKQPGRNMIHTGECP